MQRLLVRGGIDRATFVHQLYGMTLQCDLPLPAFTIPADAATADVRVHCGTAPELSAADSQIEDWEHLASTPADAPAGPWESPSGQLYRFFYQDQTEFFVSRSGADIWVRWQPPLEWPDVVTYLVGPVLGFVLRLRGRLALHASSVVINGSALALTGLAGAGKSTTAAQFALRGHQVLADDITPLLVSDSGCVAFPGYPRLCLWPDSVSALLGSHDALPNISGTWDKRYLRLDEGIAVFQAKPVPLRAIYSLGARVDDERAPYLEPLSAAQAFLALVANTYGNRRQDTAMRAVEFGALDSLARLVPLRRVSPHTDISRTAELCALIEDDFALLARN